MVSHRGLDGLGVHYDLSAFLGYPSAVLSCPIGTDGLGSLTDRWNLYDTTGLDGRIYPLVASGTGGLVHLGGLGDLCSQCVLVSLAGSGGLDAPRIPCGLVGSSGLIVPNGLGGISAPHGTHGPYYDPTGLGDLGVANGPEEPRGFYH